MEIQSVVSRKERRAMKNFNEIETLWIPLSDGVKLAARVWMPESASISPVPAILEYIPYRRRDFTRARDNNLHSKFSEAGYISIRVDIRGSGDSGGLMHDEYSDREIEDGYEVIEWIANQTWCDGSVGMMGKSWGAYNSLQVAALNPPALKAILPVMGTDDRWKEDIHFRNGLMATDNFWWGSIMQLMNTSPPDPEIVGTRWKELWLERLNSMELWTKNWASHQTNDQMWQRGSISQDYKNIKVPVFFITGWGDLFRDTPFRLAENLEVPLKILVGPWAHLYPHEAVPKPTFDFVNEAIRWWDYWLKGKKNNIMKEPRLVFYEMEHMPPKAVFESRNGRWITENKWPSSTVPFQQFYLNVNELSEKSNKESEVMEINSPQNYGMSGGDVTSFGIAGDLPLDCRNDEGGALTFRSKPIEKDLSILGQPILNLNVVSNKEQAFVSATLVDEAPDGSQALITRGFFNLMHRISDTDPKKIKQGEEMEITLSMQGVAWKLNKGHKLIVHLGSTYWPIIWPSPEPVKLGFRAGTSVLKLPVRKTPKSNDLELHFKQPEIVENKTYRTDTPGAIERDYKIDLTTGLVTHRVYIDGGVFGPVGKIYFDETKTGFHDISERIYSIYPDDPLSAKAEMKQSRCISKENLEIKLETWSQQTTSKHSFLVKAWCKCWENGDLIHSVDWNYEIPRNGM